ncbi:MAG: alpha-amylase family protein [Casimicrobiaceae bacterium]
MTRQVEQLEVHRVPNALEIVFGPSAKHREIPVTSNGFAMGASRLGITAGALLAAMMVLGILFPAVVYAQAQQPQKFLTFDYHMTPEEVDVLPNRYVFVWGDSARLTWAFAKHFPSTLLSAYFPYSRDPNATHGLNYWRASHPTWVTYRCDGVTPTYFPGDPNIPLDISNPDVISWQIAEFIHLRPGLHAVALDNFQFQNKLGICGVHDASGQFVRKYSGKLDDMAFATDRVRWLEKISAVLHERHIKVVINHIPDLSPEGDDSASPLVGRMVGAVDGILDEHAQDALHDTRKAVLLAKLVQFVQSSGKWMYLLYQYQGDSERLAESAMANYLTMAGPKSAIYIPAEGAISGLEPKLYGFDRPIGEPCGPVIAKSGVLFRTFSHGLAVYAPADRVPDSVSIPDGYQTVEGRNAGVELDLAGGRGRVLYASSGNACAHH